MELNFQPKHKLKNKLKNILTILPIYGKMYTYGRVIYVISNLKSEKENREYLKSVIGADERNYIDWKNSIGKEIGYGYDWKGECSKGVLKIVKYDTKSRKLYFEGYEKGIGSKDLAILMAKR